MSESSLNSSLSFVVGTEAPRGRVVLGEVLEVLEVFYNEK